MTGLTAHTVNSLTNNNNVRVVGAAQRWDKSNLFAYRHLKLFQIMCEAPVSPTPPMSGTVQRTWGPGGGRGQTPSASSASPLGSVCLFPEGGVRVRRGRGSPAGNRGLWLVLLFVCLSYFFFFLSLFLTDLPSLLCKCGNSVPQDDFHKASHVCFFGLMGGEEEMLLRRKITLI